MPSVGACVVAPPSEEGRGEIPIGVTVSKLIPGSAADVTTRCASVTPPLETCEAIVACAASLNRSADVRMSGREVVISITPPAEGTDVGIGAAAAGAAAASGCALSLPVALAVDASSGAGAVSAAAAAAAIAACSAGDKNIPLSCRTSRICCYGRGGHDCIIGTRYCTSQEKLLVQAQIFRKAKARSGQAGGCRRRANKNDASPPPFDRPFLRPTSTSKYSLGLFSSSHAPPPQPPPPGS